MIKNYLDYKELNPELLLLIQAINSESLSVMEQVIKLFPGMKADNVTVFGNSFWSYLILSINNDFSFANLIGEDREENKKYEDERYDALAKNIIDIFGDPFENATLSKHDALQEDEDFYKKFPKISNKTEPPSVLDNPAWKILFDKNYTLERENKLSLYLIKNILTLPNAKSYLDKWYSLYSSHPISVAISRNQPLLLKQYLHFGVDPNLKVSSSFNDRYSESNKDTSILTFSAEPRIVRRLIEHGAEPDLATIKGKKIDILACWRNTLEDSSKPSNKIRDDLSQLYILLSKVSKNEDSEIDFFVQKSLTITRSEFFNRLNKETIKIALTERRTESEEPTAYASFLSLNFKKGNRGVRDINFSLAIALTKKIKKRLGEPAPSGEPWLFHALTYVCRDILQAPYNVHNSRAELLRALNDFADELKSSSAWEKTFPSTETHAKGEVINEFSKLITHIFNPPNKKDEANLLLARCLTQQSNRLDSFFEMPKRVWDAKLDSGYTLSQHFSTQYCSHLARKRDGTERDDAELCHFSSIFFKSFFDMKMRLMIESLFHKTNTDHDRATKSGKNHHREMILSNKKKILSCLKPFFEEEKSAVLSYLLARNDDELMSHNFVVYSNPNKDGYSHYGETMDLALALLEAGVEPKLTKGQIQNKLNAMARISLENASKFESIILRESLSSGNIDNNANKHNRLDLAL